MKMGARRLCSSPAPPPADGIDDERRRPRRRGRATPLCTDAAPASGRPGEERRRRRSSRPRCPGAISTTRFFGLLAVLSVLSSTTSCADSQPLQQPTQDDLPTSPFRIVIDVGSTGSRLHIFELVTTSSVATSANAGGNADEDENTNAGSGNQRTECFRRGSSKAWTPLSAFASPSDDNGEGDAREPLNATHVAHHMLPLFDYASIIVPPVHHASTPVRIAATAGMRLLPPGEQKRVYDALHEGLTEQAASGRFTFTSLRREDVLTLNGEREGFYGAIAANYLRGVVDAELRVIVPPDADVESDAASEGRLEEGQNDDEGLCTNKFGMCEQDAENVIFGPSHHYVPGTMHDVKRHGPLGALDMGGSSTQIVYRHAAAADGGGFNESSERDGEEGEGGQGDVPSHLNDEEFFSTSYLSYGADQFRERLWDLWVSEAEKGTLQNDEDRRRRHESILHEHRTSEDEEHSLPVIFNPCSFVGYQMPYRGYSLLGTGDAVLCAEQVNRLIPHHDDVIDLDELYEDNVAREEEDLSSQGRARSLKRNMVGGVEHPPVRGKFYGMSLYFFTLDCLRELSDPDHPIRVSWPTPSIEELTHALDAFCARRWQGDLEEVQHEAHEHTRAEVLPHRCVEAVYMVTLLRDGFGFHPTSRDITFTQWVEGNEVEWSLGMALSEFAAEKGRQRSYADEFI